MKKKVLLILAAVLIITAVVAYKLLYKEHRDISSEDTSYTLSVTGLKDEFVQNDSLANAKYADQTVEISGTVTSVDVMANTIVVDEKLSAVLKESSAVSDKMQKKKVKIKGRFVGYDDLLEELKMDQVTIIN